MSWHIPPSGPSCFVCLLSGMEAAGGRESSFQLPFHQEIGRAARQSALPTLSPSHPGEDWEAEIPEDGCPNNWRRFKWAAWVLPTGPKAAAAYGGAPPAAGLVWEGACSVGSQVCIAPWSRLPVTEYLQVLLGAPSKGPAFHVYST